MKANNHRHIASGKTYNALFPKATHHDTVIKGPGKAQLFDTLSLMLKMIHQTHNDTKQLARVLKGKDRYTTCKNIWNFVYTHIQYKMDQTGIEQVRRPSRTWADRKSGVDCDCYTVFIGTLLYNLGIPFSMRITKYNGKAHFQHIYPIVPTAQGHITIDCVTDAFDKEVPYSEKKDFKHTLTRIQDTELSGVDTSDIRLDALEQPKLPLWQTYHHTKKEHTAKTAHLPKSKMTWKSSKTARLRSPFRFKDTSNRFYDYNLKKNFNLMEFALHSVISIGLGYGIYRILQPDKNNVTH